MTVEAYDTAFPDQRAREDVLINVIRNPNTPVFQNQLYTEVISETQPLGTLVLCLTATDADLDTLSYMMTGSNNLNDNAADWFFMTTSGCVYVRQLLTQAPNNQYTFSVQVRDNAYPEKFGTTSVQIQIIRDTFTPVFDQQNCYTLSIPETTRADTASSIITVRAIDDDLQVTTR